jgi:hypothetical protein
MVLLVLNKRPIEYLSGGLLLALPIGKKLVHINNFSRLFEILVDGCLYGKLRAFFMNLIFIFSHMNGKKNNELFGLINLVVEISSFSIAYHDDFCIKIISNGYEIRQMKCKYDKCPNKQISLQKYDYIKLINVATLQRIMHRKLSFTEI